MAYYTKSNLCPAKAIERPPPYIPNTTKSRVETKSKEKWIKETDSSHKKNNHNTTQQKKTCEIMGNTTHHNVHLQTQAGHSWI